MVFEDLNRKQLKAILIESEKRNWKDTTIVCQPCLPHQRQLYTFYSFGKTPGGKKFFDLNLAGKNSNVNKKKPHPFITKIEQKIQNWTLRYITATFSANEVAAYKNDPSGFLLDQDDGVLFRVPEQAKKILYTHPASTALRRAVRFINIQHPIPTRIVKNTPPMYEVELPIISTGGPAKINFDTLNNFDFAGCWEGNNFDTLKFKAYSWTKWDKKQIAYVKDILKLDFENDGFHVKFQHSINGPLLVLKLKVSGNGF